MERFADPETGTGFTRVGDAERANACEAIRDPSTSFALLTSVRMTKTARESKINSLLAEARISGALDARQMLHFVQHDKGQASCFVILSESAKRRISPSGGFWGWNQKIHKL